MGKEIFKIFEDLISWVIDQYDENVTIHDRYNEIYIATYFSTEIEYANAIKSLAFSNNYIGIPPTFRSLFEAHVDLINLCNYNDYYLVLYAIFLKQKTKN